MRFFYITIFLALFSAFFLKPTLAAWSKKNLEQIFDCSISIVITEKTNKKGSYEALFMGEGGAKSFGSGFILNSLNLPWGSRFQGSDMYVLTKYHVVEKVRGEEILVCTKSNDVDDPHNCETAAIELLDKDYDLAILRADFTLGNACSSRFAFAKDFAKDVKVGDKIMSFSNKLGLGTSGTFGHISSEERKLKRGGAVQNYSFIDANIGYGSSGAVIFGENMQIIGIASSIYSSNSNYVALMQPASDALISLERMGEMLDIESIFNLQISDGLEVSSQIKELDGGVIKFLAKKPISSNPEAKYELFKFYSDSEAHELPVVYSTKDGKLKRLMLTKPE